jgi:hypothetical protein
MANVIIDPNELMYTAFEPKIKNRFILYMDGFPSYMVKAVNGIGFEQGEIILNHINSYRKVKGSRLKWNDVTLKLFDPITPSGTQIVMDWVRLHHETVTGRAGYSDMYKKNLTVNILGPIGDVVGEWIIKGAFIKGSNMGDWDWDVEDEAQEVEFTVGMDAMIHNF